MRIVGLVCLLFVAITTESKGQISGNKRSVEHLSGLHRVSLGDNIGSFSIFEMGLTEVNKDENRYFYFPLITLGSAVYQDLDNKESQWSYSLPINLIAALLYRAISGRYDSTDHGESSPWIKYLLVAPNCMMSRRIGQDNFLSYGMTTDYLFSRKDDNPPGILTRPFIGFSIDTGKPSRPSLVTLAVGPTWFLNLDGNDHS